MSMRTLVPCRLPIATIAAALILAPAALAQQYKSTPGLAPSSEIPAAYAGKLAPGFQIADASGKPYCEIWFVKTAPSGPKTNDDAVTLQTFPVGSLLGVVRFDGNGSDRRGQQVKPGVYALRYAWMPNTGTHVGAAPQRDFGLLVRIADDKDPAATFTLDQTINLSRQASGTGHPLVFSLASGTGSEGFTKENDHDWTLHTKVGGQALDMIVIGKVES
jgi:hypothetical protein